MVAMACVGFGCSDRREMPTRFLDGCDPTLPDACGDEELYCLGGTCYLLCDTDEDCRFEGHQRKAFFCLEGYWGGQGVCHK